MYLFSKTLFTNRNNNINANPEERSLKQKVNSWQDEDMNVLNN